MSRAFKDETGNRYGKLVVLERSNRILSSRRKDITWKCICDCGELSTVSGTTLRGHKTLSCGCSKRTDKTGKRYKKLTVIRRDPLNKHNWICKCDCGNTVSVKTNLLQEGGGKGSCGCLEEIISVTLGQKFGKLTVLNKIPDTSNQWNCICECGNSTNVHGFSLVRGTKQSCGRKCSRRGKNIGEASFNVLYSSYRKSAKRRNVLWELSIEEFKDITSSTCFYCGVSPQRVAHGKTKLNGNYLYNGVDRVDNGLGYTFNNSVTCCWNCNRAKQILSQSEFKNWVIRVYRNWAKG